MFFDPIDSKCKPCPADHTYSKVTGRCECFKCEAPRAMNPVTNQCECKAVNGTQMIYKEDTNECVCPSNLPLWNGKYCVACPPATEYDSKERQCYHCPEGFVRDYNSHSCVPGLWGRFDSLSFVYLEIFKFIFLLVQGNSVTLNEWIWFL